MNDGARGEGERASERASGLGRGLDSSLCHGSSLGLLGGRPSDRERVEATRRLIEMKRPPVVEA